MPNLPRQAPQRAVVHASDVERITGVRPRTARHLLQQIRKKLGKQKHEFITIGEFAAYSGIPEKDVRACLLD